MNATGYNFMERSTASKNDISWIAQHRIYADKNFNSKSKLIMIKEDIGKMLYF